MSHTPSNAGIPPISRPPSLNRGYQLESINQRDLEILENRGAINLSLVPNPGAVAGLVTGEPEVTSFPQQGNHFADVHATAFPAPDGFFQVGPYAGESTHPDHHLRHLYESDSDAESSA